MFLVPLMIAKFLPTEVFGAFSLGMMIVFLFNSLLFRPPLSPLIIYGNEELKKTGRLSKTFSSAFVYSVSALIISFLAFILFMSPIAAFTKLQGNVILLLFAALAGISIKDFFESCLLAQNRKLASGVYGVVAGLLIVLWLIFIFAFDIISLETVLLSYFVAAAGSLLSCIMFLNFRVLIPFQFDKSNFSSLFAYSRWITFGGAAAYLLNWGDNIALRFYVDFHNIGVYNLGYQVLKGMIIVMAIIPAYFSPELSQNTENTQKLKHYLYNKRPRILLLGACCIGIVYLVIPYVIEFVYGNQYAGAPAVARVLLIGSLFALYKACYACVLASHKKYKFINITLALLVCFNIGFDFLLVPVYGIMGAAYATALTYAMMALCYEIYFRKTFTKEVNL